MSRIHTLSFGNLHCFSI